jgi:hypothetical protein
MQNSTFTMAMAMAKKSGKMLGNTQNGFFGV